MATDHISPGVGGSVSASSVAAARVRSNPEPGQTNTFILLHGFFFLEVQNDKLVIASPRVTGHTPFQRDHGARHRGWDGRTIESGPSLVAAGTAPQFPLELLQFSRAKAGVPDGQFFIDAAKQDDFAAFVELPLPDAIVPLRKGTKDHYHPDRTKNVPQSIDHLCGNSNNVALIVFLQYSSNPLFTRNYYIEHSVDPGDIGEVNDMFQVAADEFGRPGFDFRITKLDKTPVPTGKDNVPVGIDSNNDEEAIGEVLVDEAPPSANTRRTIAVATCPMFGIVQ